LLAHGGAPLLAHTRRPTTWLQHPCARRTDCRSASHSCPNSVGPTWPSYRRYCATRCRTCSRGRCLAVIETETLSGRARLSCIPEREAPEMASCCISKPSVRPKSAYANPTRRTARSNSLEPAAAKLILSPPRIHKSIERAPVAYWRSVLRCVAGRSVALSRVAARCVAMRC
jgi:hypothetical protein